ncbi:N-acetylmuramoyl-L-alanine amidase-like domain-containing protein [Pseudomonas syringae]|uniref:N-acetylmuramoyl-L-alanine amidase-like domain-containing protein n=1 Tax=Pseudomonas syringae TaxID=317 RepID=UPI003F84E927
MKSNEHLTPKFSIQLGSWDITLLEEMLTNQIVSSRTYSNNVSKWLDALTGTPFRFESSIPVADDAMLINLESFDCITFVYHVLALSGATSVREYIMRLYHLRYINYPNYAISNDSQYGNFFDYACEALLVNATRENILRDITCDVGLRTEPLSMILSPINRPAQHDAKRTLVFPRYLSNPIETPVIEPQQLEFLDPNIVEDGDLVIFTHGIKKNNITQPTLVCHAGFVKKVNGIIGLVHATKNYSISEKHHNFKHITEKPHCYLPGVSIAGEYLGDEKIVMHNGHKYYGYNLDSPRPLADYAKNFFAVKLFRLVG